MRVEPDGSVFVSSMPSAARHTAISAVVIGSRSSRRIVHRGPVVLVQVDALLPCIIDPRSSKRSPQAAGAGLLDHDPAIAVSAGAAPRRGAGRACDFRVRPATGCCETDQRKWISR